MCEAVSKSLDENQLRIRHLLHNIHVKIVKKELLHSLGMIHEESYFFNMNHPDEYHKALTFKGYRWWGWNLSGGYEYNELF